MKRKSWLMLAFVATAGCSSKLAVQRLPAGAPTQSDVGVPYQMVRPHFEIVETPNATAGLPPTYSANVVYYTDPDARFGVQVDPALFVDVDFTLDFGDEGRLDSIGVKTTETVTPLVKSLGTFAGAVLGAAAGNLRAGVTAAAADTSSIASIAADELALRLEGAKVPEKVRLARKLRAFAADQPFEPLDREELAAAEAERPTLEAEHDARRKALQARLEDPPPPPELPEPPVGDPNRTAWEAARKTRKTFAARLRSTVDASTSTGVAEAVNRIDTRFNALRAKMKSAQADGGSWEKLVQAETANAEDLFGDKFLDGPPHAFPEMLAEAVEADLAVARHVGLANAQVRVLRSFLDKDKLAWRRGEIKRLDDLVDAETRRLAARAAIDHDAFKLRRELELQRAVVLDAFEQQRRVHDLETIVASTLVHTTNNPGGAPTTSPAYSQLADLRTEMTAALAVIAAKRTAILSPGTSNTGTSSTGDGPPSAVERKVRPCVLVLNKANGAAASLDAQINERLGKIDPKDIPEFVIVLEPDPQGDFR